MSTPRWRQLLLIALVLALLAAACGGEETGTADDSATDAGEETAEVTETEAEAEADPGEVITLQFASFLGEGAPQSQVVEWWGEQLEERSNGRIQVETFFSESLLAGTDILPGVSDGRAQAGWTGNFYHPADLPLLSVVELPFVTSNGPAQAQALLDLYRDYEPFREEFQRNGVHLAFIPPLGTNVVGTSDQPIASLNDLSGLSIRAAGLLVGALQEVGANPVALAAPEIYESLQRGVIDGYTSMTLEVIPALGLHEETNYLAETGNGQYVTGMHILNLDLYESLDPELRDLIDEVSEEAQSQAVEYLAEVEMEVCQQLLDAGIEVSTLDEEVVEQWREDSPDFEAEWLEAREAEGLPATEFYERYRELLQQYEDEGEYEIGVRRCAQQSD